ncbi:MAG: flagellar assembly protein FliH [Methylobacter sp.]
MNSSKTPRFTESELEALTLWSLPNVYGPDGPKEPEPVELDEPTPILTVDEIEAMQQQAYDEAFELGKKQGFQEGYAEGSKKGYEENAHLLQSQAAIMVSLLESLSEPFKKLDDEVEQELVRLAISIAAQIIRREIKLNPGQIVGVVREAVNVLPLSSQKISLKLHPDDADVVRSALALDDISPSWGIIEDPLIARGGCEVDTDVSHVDATVEHRLAAVIATVLGGERDYDKAAAVLNSGPSATDSSRDENTQNQNSAPHLAVPEINTAEESVAVEDSLGKPMPGVVAEDQNL